MLIDNCPFVAYRSADPNDELQILRIFPKEYTHQHYFFEFVYVLQGSATLQLPEAHLSVSAGNYYIIDPRNAHGIENVQKLRAVGCLFDASFIDRVLSDCPSLSLLLSNRVMRFGVPIDIPVSNRVFNDADGSVRRIVQQMEREYSRQETGYMEVLRCCLIQILVSAIRSCDTRLPHNAIAKVVEYLKLHYTEPLSLPMLGDFAGYTPQYLSNLFRKEIGINIQTFLQQLRIEKASELLISTDMSITEIAASVGYQDTRHFSKLFRRYRQNTPKEYRKAFSGKKNSALLKGDK